MRPISAARRGLQRARKRCSVPQVCPSESHLTTAGTYRLGGRSTMAKLVSRGLRFDKKRVDEIAKAARDAGYSSQSAFMRAAIDRELRGRENDLDETELRVTASLDRVARELRGVRLGHQALFAFVDSLAKTL